MSSIPDTLTIDGEVYVRQTTAKAETESKPFPQEGAMVWIQEADGEVLDIRFDSNNDWHLDLLKQGRIHLTEADAIRANEVEAANAAIKRWRDENVPFVADWTECNQPKWWSKYDHLKKRYCATVSWAEESFNTIYFRTCEDLTRCQSELPDAWAALVERQG